MLLELIVSILIIGIMFAGSLGIQQGFLKKTTQTSLAFRSAAILNLTKHIAVTTQRDASLVFNQKTARIDGVLTPKLFNPIPLETSRQNQTIGFKPSARPKYAGSVLLDAHKIIITPRTGRIRIETR